LGSSTPVRLRSGRGTSFELRIQSRASFASHAGPGTPDIVYWYRRWGVGAVLLIKKSAEEFATRYTACATWNSYRCRHSQAIIVANSEGEKSLRTGYDGTTAKDSGLRNSGTGKGHAHFERGLYLCRQLPTLPHTFACSTIGPAGLNFRVRDGNGWNPRGKITDKSEPSAISRQPSANPAVATDTADARQTCKRAYL
jgi:hypothetical protein